jgi:hypothetical protein
MNVKIDYVDFCFENCDTLRVQGDSIKSLLFYGVKTDIVCDPFTGRHESQSCESFRVVIESAANVNRHQFDEVNLPEETAFERASSKDLVSVYVMYNDGTCDDIYVPYEEDKYSFNKLMDAEINEDGDLVISITK